MSSSEYQPHFVADSSAVARVKKIISIDDDVAACSNNAAFVITIATEMFVQYLVERTHDVVKSERKPRRNIQYRDVSNAVARVDNLEFLSDVVPRTQSLKSFRDGQAKRLAQQAASARAPAAAQADVDVQMHDAQQAIPVQQPQQQLPPYQQIMQQPQPGYVPLQHVPNGAPAPMTNGHISHSRNHSLEHQNILHPQHPPGPM
ncbi:MAG: NFYB/HAP3 family transcription factor subunit [Terriglobus roseus]|nr:NFYB/HAP3 family transcription factor subunit [Terriglobus roseus]